MKTKLAIIFILCSNFHNLNAEWDRLILYEDGGFLLNETTSFTTTEQRAKYIFCGSQKGCCKCSTGTCDTEKVVDDLTVALNKISNSTALRLGQVAKTVTDAITDIRRFHKKSDEKLSRENLSKNIAKTFQILVNITSSICEAIGSVGGYVIEVYSLLQIDLQQIVDARTVQSKNSAGIALGHHIVILLDMTAELTKLTCNLCNLSGNVSEGIYSIILATTAVLFFIKQTIATNADLVSKVGLKNDTASNICLHVSSAMKQYVSVVQSVSECPNVQCLKDNLQTMTTSLCEIRTKFSNDMGSAIGFTTKYPSLSPALFGVVDCIMDCVKGSQHLKDAEDAISEAIVALLDICKSIQTAILSCTCINGFTSTVDALVLKVLTYLHTIFFMIANIDDDCFSSGNSLSIFLAAMDSIVMKVMCSIDDVIQSILNLGEITIGGRNLLSMFEAVVDVSAGVLQSVAFIFTELMRGSHMVNLPATVPRIMVGLRNQIITARDRLNENLESCDIDDQYNVDKFIDASLTILSFNEFRSNVANIVSDLDCAKGDNTVDDKITTKVDIFIGKLKRRAKELETNGIGKVISEAVNEICDESYDTLIRLSTLSFDKGEVLKLICLMVSNDYFAVVSLNSIFNCVHYGIQVSVF